MADGDDTQDLNDTQDLAPWSNLKADAPEINFPFGVTARIVANAARTHGAFGMIEAVYPPGQGFPMHIHHNEDEFQYILEGKLLIVSGDTRVVAGPGDFFFGPKGLPHGFKSVGDVPARFLEGVLPGGLEALMTTPALMIAAVVVGHSGPPFNFEIVGPAPEMT